MKAAAKKATTTTTTTREKMKGDVTMTNASTHQESERARKTRENQEKKLAHVRELIDAANQGTVFARGELVQIVSKAISYHDSGKIEGLHSLDTACMNNEFCPRMQATDDPTIICRYCYTTSFWQAAIFAHYITGLILSEVSFTDQEAAFIAIPAFLLRFNSDGELINATHAANLVRIAATHPQTACAIWTKRPGILNSVIMTYGKPANLICGVSSPMINTPCREGWTWCDFVFTVYTPEGMRQALARGEHECNGKKCLACGFHCYKRHDTSAGPVYVAELLRRPKGVTAAAFPGIIAAIDAATLNRN